MGTQTSASRREAALAAASKVGPMRDELADAIAEQQARYAQRRAERQPPERRDGDRRVEERRETGAVDGRRVEERRTYPTMADKLAAEARAQEQPDSTRYTGSPSAFMESLK